MIRRGAVREYVTGSLWVLPGVRALLALLVGSAFGPDRRQLWLAVGAAGVPGHRDDARPGERAVSSRAATEAQGPPGSDWRVMKLRRVLLTALTVIGLAACSSTTAQSTPGTSGSSTQAPPSPPTAAPASTSAQPSVSPPAVTAPPPASTRAASSLSRTAPASTSAQPSVSPPAVTTAPPTSTLTGPLLLITPQVVASSQDYGVIEPTSINPAADAHNLISKIVWSSWTNVEATGSGYAVSENCVPNCAQGNLTQVPVVIQLGSVVNNRYTSMKWGTNVLQGPTLILVGSLGGQRVPAPGAAAAPATGIAPRSAASAAPPLPVRNYNDLQQLAQAVGRTVEETNGRAVTGASCQLTGTPGTFRCVVNQGGSTFTATGVVAPDGQSFTMNPLSGG